MVFAEENYEARKTENAGIDPRTMRIGKWYQESTREDDDPRSPASNRVSDLAGADRMSYQVREPIEKDEDRLAMQRGDICQSENSRRSSITRISFEVGQDAPCHFQRRFYKKHGLIVSDLSSHNLRETQVQMLNFSTCQRTSVAFFPQGPPEGDHLANSRVEMAVGEV